MRTKFYRILIATIIIVLIGVSTIACETLDFGYTVKLSVIPAKLTYDLGEELDFSDAILSVKSEMTGDETFLQFDDPRISVRDFDNRCSGEQILVIAFTEDDKEYTTGITVTVTEEWLPAAKVKVECTLTDEDFSAGTGGYTLGVDGDINNEIYTVMATDITRLDTVTIDSRVISADSKITLHQQYFSEIRSDSLDYFYYKLEGRNLSMPWCVLMCTEQRITIESHDSIFGFSYPYTEVLQYNVQKIGSCIYITFASPVRSGLNFAYLRQGDILSAEEITDHIAGVVVVRNAIKISSSRIAPSGALRLYLSGYAPIDIELND